MTSFQSAGAGASFWGSGGGGQDGGKSTWDRFGDWFTPEPTLPPVGLGPPPGLGGGFDEVVKKLLHPDPATVAKQDPDYAKDPAKALAKAELADAQADLAGMFDVGPVKPGNKAGNAVTVAQMADIAKLYADIKNGHSDLVIDPKSALNPEADKDKNKQAILGDLAHILQTKSGRDLIGALSNNFDGKHHHKTTIDLPLANGNETTGDKDAAGTVHPNVHYNAGAVNTIPGADPKLTSANLIRSDVALYHELVHAYHQSKGTGASGFVTDKMNLSKHDLGVQASEYQATGLGAWAPGGAEAKKGHAPFTETGYILERHDIAVGQHADPSAANKKAFPDWADHWSDAKIQPRKSYLPD